MLSIQTNYNTQIELDEKSPLYAILSLLDKDQEGDVELSLEEHEAISELLKNKVDSCALFMSELESETERLKKIAKTFADAAKATERKMERFEKYILHVLKTNSITRLSGEVFELKDTLGREKVVVAEKLTPDLEMAYPLLVRVKTEWSLEAIKDAIKSGEEVPFASLQRDSTAKFSIKRKVK